MYKVNGQPAILYSGQRIRVKANIYDVKEYEVEKKRGSNSRYYSVIMAKIWLDREYTDKLSEKPQQILKLLELYTCYDEAKNYGEVEECGIRNNHPSKAPFSIIPWDVCGKVGLTIDVPVSMVETIKKAQKYPAVYLDLKILYTKTDKIFNKLAYPYFEATVTDLKIIN